MPSSDTSPGRGVQFPLQVCVFMYSEPSGQVRKAMQPKRELEEWLVADVLEMK